MGYAIPLTEKLRFSSKSSFIERTFSSSEFCFYFSGLKQLSQGILMELLMELDVVQKNVRSTNSYCGRGTESVMELAYMGGFII